VVNNAGVMMLMAGGKRKPTKKQVKNEPTKPNRSNLVIGLTGPFGSGCGEMRKILEKLKFCSFKISEDIRKELREKKGLIEKGELGWRKVLQDHGNKRRKKNRAYWIEKVRAKIDQARVGNKDIVIDGFRNFQEVQEIRRIYPLFFLVAIYAEKDERWKRVRDDYNGRYNEFETDDRRDRNEDFDWGQSVQKCVDDADYVYFNNEHLVISQQGKELPKTQEIERTLTEQADDFVKLMKGEKNPRLPMPEEVQIAAAYVQSNSSTCEKRHVGAVITREQDGQEFPISMGFNENPGRVNTCSKQGACYKDEDMISKLGALKKIHCIFCGKKHDTIKKPWVCCECGASFKEWLHRNRNMELCMAIHAEERAILSLNGRSAEDSTLYVTTFPCFQCARLIIDAGIKRIVYVEAYPTPETAKFLKEANIDVQPFSGFTARSFFRVFPKVN